MDVYRLGKTVYLISGKTLPIRKEKKAFVRDVHQ